MLKPLENVNKKKQLKKKVLEIYLSNEYHRDRHQMFKGNTDLTKKDRIGNDTTRNDTIRNDTIRVMSGVTIVVTRHPETASPDCFAR